MFGKPIFAKKAIPDAGKDNQRLVSLMKKTIPVIILLLCTCFSFSQAVRVDSLLQQVASIKNSKDIARSEPAQGIMTMGVEALGHLVPIFPDSAATEVYSECTRKYLRKGELAMILADRIEMMPYALLTGVQNCLFQFCDQNPNFIEYYFPYLESMGVNEFQKRYVAWLHSRDRKKMLKTAKKTKSNNLR